MTRIRVFYANSHRLGMFRCMRRGNQSCPVQGHRQSICQEFFLRPRSATRSKVTVLFFAENAGLRLFPTCTGHIGRYIVALRGIATPLRDNLKRRVDHIITMQITTASFPFGKGFRAFIYFQSHLSLIPDSISWHPGYARSRWSTGRISER